MGGYRPQLIKGILEERQPPNPPTTQSPCVPKVQANLFPVAYLPCFVGVIRVPYIRSNDASITKKNKTINKQSSTCAKSDINFYS